MAQPNWSQITAGGLSGALAGAGTGAFVGSAVPGVGTALGALVGGATGLFAGGSAGGLANRTSTPGGYNQVPLYSQEQQTRANQVGQMGLENLQNPYKGYEQLEQQARDFYQQQLVPDVAGQFTGATNGRFSSGNFTQQLGNAGSGLSALLNKQKMDYAQRNREFGLQQLQFGGGQQFQNQAVDAQAGWLNDMLSQLGDYGIKNLPDLIEQLTSKKGKLSNLTPEQKKILFNHIAGIKGKLNPRGGQFANNPTLNAVANPAQPELPTQVQQALSSPFTPQTQRQNIPQFLQGGQRTPTMSDLATTQNRGINPFNPFQRNPSVQLGGRINPLIANPQPAARFNPAQSYSSLYQPLVGQI